jgi:hypothetical protein
MQDIEERRLVKTLDNSLEYLGKHAGLMMDIK